MSKCQSVLQRLVLLVALLSVSTALNTAPRRLGCFKDNKNRVLENSDNWHTKLSAASCLNICHDFDYAGLQDSTQCCCGDRPPAILLSDAVCNKTCPGDSGQTCGGMWALEVFPVETKPDIQGTRVGCFEDSVERFWNSGMIVLQSCSPRRCFNACRGFKYAGLQVGSECHCGDTLPSTPLSEPSCLTQCRGLPGKTCGGPWEMEVFELSEPPVVVLCPDTDYQIEDDLGTYKLYTERKSWDDAWQQCENDDAHLVIINSEQEAEFVSTLFAKVPYETRMHAGFHDLLRKGIYQTIYGVLLDSAGYDIWSAQFPKIASPIKHCGSLDVHGHLAQIDGNCNAQAVFVCEKKTQGEENFVLVDARGKLDTSGL